MKKRITVVGSLNMDLVMETRRFPGKGETLRGKSFFTNPGGKGANQAVAAARLGGSKVYMAGMTGKDDFGRLLTDELRENGVDVSLVGRTGKAKTGTAIIIVSPEDNRIIITPGANGCLGCRDIEKMEDKIAASSVVLLQLEIPLEIVEKTVSVCKKHKVHLILDPAPAAELSEELLSSVDTLTPNETEAGILTGTRVESVEEAQNAVQVLLGRGVKRVVITLGKKGAVYNEGSRILQQTAPSVSAVDTTAAGDAFNGALAVAFTEGYSFPDSVEFACRAGALAAAGKGAMGSLPTRKAAEELFLP